jgi:hypothetical protein
MTPRSARKRFLQFIHERGRELASLYPADGIELMLAFYKDERADGCLKRNGDMLLYQWGCYDWGEGESFEFDITRQFIDGAGEDEDIRQLSLTFQFRPTKSLRKLKDGNRWCHSPKELNDFRRFIDSSAPYEAIAMALPARVSLESGIAG